MKDVLDYKLCYVKSSEYIGDEIMLFFTELDDVTRQWGDDWDDVPYEHNAGDPYEYDYDASKIICANKKEDYPKIDIFKIIIKGAYNIITPRYNTLNSNYSVKDINAGKVPWLIINTYDTSLNKNEVELEVKAGTPLKEVLRILSVTNKCIDVYKELTSEEYKSYLQIER